MKKILPLIVLLLAVTLAGCQPLVAHDPAKQAAIDNRQRLDAAWKLYAIVERQATAAYSTGAISRSTDLQIIGKLQTVIHPLLDKASTAIDTGDYAPLIVQIETELTALSAKTPTTRPAK